MKNIIIATKDECDYIATDLKQVSVKLVFNKSVKVIIKATYADRSEQLRFNANDVKFTSTPNGQATIRSTSARPGPRV